MKKALENLKAKVRNKQIKIVRMDVLDKLEIKPSHYYVKFKPKTDEQEGLMRNDSTLELFDYPLDWEFTNDYLDNRPDPPEGTFLDYYTSVSVDKVLPDKVPRETLAVLYIPEQDSILNKAGNEDILIYLRNEAFTLTGNEDDLLEEPPKGPQAREAWWFIGSKWYPSGTIQFWDDGVGKHTFYDTRISHWVYYDCPDDRDSRDDDFRERTRRCRWPDYTYTKRTVRGKYVPLVAARILIRQWFTIRKTFTNENGYFRAGSVRGKARYVVKWERYHYSIRRGWIFQAFIRGPVRKKQAWSRNIKGGRDEYHAAIHTAAYTYYYGDRFGLTSPPRNIWYRRQIRIVARNQEHKSSYVKKRRWWLGNDISIQRYHSDSDQVFGTTIHELAHAAHKFFARNEYNDIVWDAYTRPCITRFNCHNNLSPSMNSKRRLLETWASTVEIVFALQRYRDDFGQQDYEYDDNNFQNRKINSNKSHSDNHYTSAGYDMIDDLDQRAKYGGFSSFPRDSVSGYTVKQLEDAMRTARTWSGWKDRIRDIDTGNPTRKHLDELFNSWPD